MSDRETARCAICGEEIYRRAGDESVRPWLHTHGTDDPHGARPDEATEDS